MDDTLWTTLANPSASSVDRTTALARLVYKQPDVDADRIVSTIQKWLASEDSLLHEQAIVTLLSALCRDEYVPHALALLENLTPEDEGGPLIELFCSAAHALSSYSRQTGKERRRILFDLADAMLRHPNLDAKQSAYTGLMTIVKNVAVPLVPHPFEYPGSVDVQMVERIRRENAGDSP